MIDLDSKDGVVNNSKEQIREEDEGRKIVTEGASSELLSNVQITFNRAKQEYIRHLKREHSSKAGRFLWKMKDIASSDEEKKELGKIIENLEKDLDMSIKEYSRHKEAGRKEEAHNWVINIAKCINLLYPELSSGERIDKFGAITDSV